MSEERSSVSRCRGVAIAEGWKFAQKCIVTLVPLPSSLLTLTEASMSFATSLTMLRPRPVPDESESA